MTIDPATPVIVGVGQVTNRPGSQGDGPLTDRPEPVGLMIDAVRAAIEDCDGVPPGGIAPSGRSLIGRNASMRVVNPTSWEYANPGAAVAEALGIGTFETMVTTVGGNNPQYLVNATALAIGRGDLDVAVLVGADCGFTQAAARRDPDRPVLSWTVQPADTPRPGVFGTDRRGTTDAEEERGLDLPIHVYPLFENALRAKSGHSLDEHRHRIAALWSRMSEAAESNPYAWLPTALTPDEIATPSERNRMIAYPYTKLMTANAQVDQGAALIICSAGAAMSAGVPRDRWVFPLAGADADDHWFLSHRYDFHSSPAIRLCGASALNLVASSIGDISHIDLYPCFPSAVEIAAADLGLAMGDPSRPLTVTGGLTLGGGPGDNYGSHAVASMVATLRSDPGSLGMVTGHGWYLSRHSVGIYGTEPSSSAVAGGRDMDKEPLERTVIQRAGGFAWADPQIAVGSLPQCTPDADARGEVTVETYSVTYGRNGLPERAVVACRTPDGLRAWASVTDPDHLTLLVTEEGCGRLGNLRDGEVDLR